MADGFPEPGLTPSPALLTPGTGSLEITALCWAWDEMSPSCFMNRKHGVFIWWRTKQHFPHCACWTNNQYDVVSCQAVICLLVYFRSWGEGGGSKGWGWLGKALLLAQNLSGLEFNDHFLHSGLPLQVISLNTHQQSTGTIEKPWKLGFACVFKVLILYCKSIFLNFVLV